MYLLFHIIKIFGAGGREDINAGLNAIAELYTRPAYVNLLLFCEQFRICDENLWKALVSASETVALSTTQQTYKDPLQKFIAAYSAALTMFNSQTDLDMSLDPKLLYSKEQVLEHFENCCKVLKANPSTSAQAEASHQSFIYYIFLDKDKYFKTDQSFSSLTVLITALQKALE